MGSINSKMITKQHVRLACIKMPKIHADVPKYKSIWFLVQANQPTSIDFAYAYKVTQVACKVKMIFELINIVFSKTYMLMTSIIE